MNLADVVSASPTRFPRALNLASCSPDAPSLAVRSRNPVQDSFAAMSLIRGKILRRLRYTGVPTGVCERSQEESSARRRGQRVREGAASPDRHPASAHGLDLIAFILDQGGRFPRIAGSSCWKPQASAGGGRALTPALRHPGSPGGGLADLRVFRQTCGAEQEPSQSPDLRRTRFSQFLLY